MLQIGRRLYFDLTGKLLLDTGERMGSVRETTVQEDFTVFPQLHGLTEANVQVVNMGYGDRASEFANMGSIRLEDGQVVIYPRLTIQVDYPQITTTQTATIIVTTDNDCSVNFQVNDGVINSKSTINKQATFTFQSDVSGTYIVKASTELYGSGSVEVTVSA